MDSKKYYIYILECKNNTYYTGYTTDIERRYKEHLIGSSKCKYTRINPPIKIAAYWEFYCSLSDILKIEHAIKKLTKQKKSELIKNTGTIKDLIN